MRIYIGVPIPKGVFDTLFESSSGSLEVLVNPLVVL